MKKTPPALLVLAAGMGSRYGGLKQIDPVGPAGETVLDYSVHDALRAGFGKIIFVIRREFESAFRAQVAPRFERRAEIRYIFQDLRDLPAGRPCPPGREKPWGTGHAVWCARHAIAEPFAVINADDFYGADSFRQLAAFLTAAAAASGPARACMVGYRLDRTLSEHGSVSRGICEVDASRRLVSIEECTAIEALPAAVAAAGGNTIAAIQRATDRAPARKFTGAETASMNCWGFPPEILPALENHLAAFLAAGAGSPAALKREFYLPAAVADMLARREAEVTVLPTASRWFGITYREDRPRVVAALRALADAGEYPARLWEN